MIQKFFQKRNIMLGKFVCCILIIILIPSYCLTINAEDYVEKTPSEVLEIFYDALLSDKKVSELPDILADVDSFAVMLRKSSEVKNNNSSSKALVWQYLRENRALFLYEKQIRNPHMTIEKVGRQFLFSNFSKPELFFEGTFSIILIAPLDRGKDSTAMKIIEFPFEKNKRFAGYSNMIDICAVLINGFSIIPLDERYSDNQFYKDIGFGGIDVKP